MTTSGVYEIRHKKTGQCYIGSSVNMPARKWKHFSYLRKGIHHSQHLQNAFNKYGEDAFEFLVIEEVPDRDMLVLREQYWIETRHPRYNMNPNAANHLGLKHSEAARRKQAEKATGRKHTAASLEKMRLAKEGIPQSEEFIQARVKGMMGHEVSVSARRKSAESIRAVWESRTPEERHRIATNRPPISDETRTRQRESHLGQTQTTELVQKRIDASWRSKTDEEKTFITEKKRTTWANKSPEELAQIAAKKRATRAAKRNQPLN